MKKNRNSESGFFNPRIIGAFILCSGGLTLGTLSLSGPVSPNAAVARVAPRFEITPAAQAYMEAMPWLSRKPIEATFQWIASFGPPDVPRPSGMRRSASNSRSVGGQSPSVLTPIVGEAVNATISPAARDLAAFNVVAAPWMDREEGQLPNRVRQGPPDPLEADPVIQRSATTTAMPALSASFPGIGVEQACENCLPPDPNGAVGPNHYVQMVNSSFQIYNKATGAPLLPTHACSQNPGNQCAPYTSSLWALTPNSECFQHNDGDGIVVYDQLADRWLISQFAVVGFPNEPDIPKYSQCIAISTSPDPTGTYYLYEFDTSSDTNNDYPKIGLWPDGYYMSVNLFSPNAVVFSDGAGAYVFERPKMLLGQPARYVYFDETGLSTGCTQGSPPCTYVPNGQLPTSLEGKNPPPAGMPNYFFEVDDTNTPNTPPAVGLHDEMHIWKFHVDWTNPANSTFGTGSSTPAARSGYPGLSAGNGGQPDLIVPIADFLKSACQIENGPDDCSPQPAATGQPPQYLDVLGDRLMHRATYRNFGDHESLVISHTVDAQADQPSGVTRNGVRWYELRSVSTAPSVYQQGTFAPLPDPTDPTSVTNGPLWRWMGSAAMDHSGDIAIGYSASGPNYFPSLHYAGRLATDPSNELTQGEAVLFAGHGIEAQVGVFPFRNRWGDYSALQVDPSDDCTFWYTNQYMVSSTGDILVATWETHIGAFKFPQCVPPGLPPLTGVVSRKTHGALTPPPVGPGDLPLNLSTPVTIEPRAGGGTSGTQTLVFSFQNVLNTVSSVTATANGTDLPAANISHTLSGNVCTVDLTGVPNASHLSVTLHGVIDSQSKNGDVTQNMDVLYGDVNQSGNVDAADVGQVQRQNNQAVTTSNYLKDVNVSGNIDAADVGQVQRQNSKHLP